MGYGKNQHGALIDGVAADAAEASRTFTLAVGVAESIGIAISLTQSAATTINATLYKSADGGTTYARVPSIAITSGAGTARDYTLSKSVTGSDTLWMDSDVRNCTHVKLIVSATGGGSSDLITVRVCSVSPW